MITWFLKLFLIVLHIQVFILDNKTDELSALIAEAVEFRNDLIARVNNPDGKDNPKIVKAYYKSVEKDLITGVDKFFDRLS